MHTRNSMDTLERRDPPSAPGTVLVVDDSELMRRLLERLLVAEGHVVLTAADGDEAVEMARLATPDVVLMDVRMPRRGGFDACRTLKSLAATRLVPIVLMTGSAERQDRIHAIEAGADDFLTKPVDEAELRARMSSLIRLKRYTDELDSAQSTMLSLALTIEARDPSTGDHCHRLAAYAVALGRRLGLTEDALRDLHRGGYLHDIGKIAVPDAVLLKPGPLTADEWHAMRRHTVVGDHLCASLRGLQSVRPIVRHHHERLDGTGYPDGLRGDAVPLLAQVVSVVDAFDAMTSLRPYQQPISVPQAVSQLEQDVLRGWRRPDIVRAFAALTAEGGLDQALADTPRLVPDPLDGQHSDR